MEVAKNPRLLKGNSINIAGIYNIVANLISGFVVIKKADFFVAVSQPLRQRLLESGIPKERTELIYNGVDTHLFKPSEQQTGVFTVTYAGAYQKWQGVENFVKAAYLLAR